jgi:tRNA (cmo5U34)-methyltransferase
MSETTTSLGHLPGEKWAFDETVTQCFSDMLRRSIPQHDLMRQTVFDIARRYVRPFTDVVDMGCSRGDALAPLVDEFGANCRFIGLEVSEPMLAAARERFAGFIRCGVVDIRQHDLRKGLPCVKPSVVLSILTTQFTPLEYRHKIIKSVYDRLIPGGAFVLVEKILGEHAALDDLLVDLYYAGKASNGYSQEEIQRKRMALEGVLVPVTAKWNEQLLRSAGFGELDMFWRFLNFAGWVAVKPKGAA